MDLFRETLDAQNRATIRRRLFQITYGEYNAMSPAERDEYQRLLFAAWERNYEIQEGVAPRSDIEQSVEDYDDPAYPHIPGVR